MPRPRTWTDDKLSELEQLLNNGWSQQKIADYYGVTQTRIYQVIKTYGLVPKYIRNHKWAGQKLRTLAILRNLGYTRKQLAEYFGITVSGINYVIDSYPIKRKVETEYRKLTISDLEKLYAWREQGYSWQRIAIKLGGKWTGMRARNAYRYYAKRAAQGHGPWVGRICNGYAPKEVS